MRKDTIIFDLDGTLLDTLDDLRNSVNYALAKKGYPERSREEIRQFVGNGVKNLVTRSLPDSKATPDFDEVFDLFKDHYAEHCNDITGPYQGIMPLLEEFKKKGYKMAIVSNKSDSAVKKLAKLHFNSLIPIAIGEKESEGIRKKPAPDTVNESLRLLESDREASVYVGDSEVDIATAKNSQMDVILCSWGFRGRKFLEDQGDFTIIDRPEELLQLV